VQVSIKGADDREVVNTVTDGPWLILNLPNGRYSAQASIAPGNVQSGFFDVDGSNRKYGFMFREP
jgi:hypothetical protein